MDNLNEEIDALLEFSLDEAPSRIGSLNVRDFLKFPSKKKIAREKEQERYAKAYADTKKKEADAAAKSEKEKEEREKEAAQRKKDAAQRKKDAKNKEKAQRRDMVRKAQAKAKRSRRVLPPIGRVKKDPNRENCGDYIEYRTNQLVKRSKYQFRVALQQAKEEAVERYGCKGIANENKQSTGELVPIVIDLEELKNNKLNESFLSMFGGWVEHLLGAMFGVRSPAVSVRGSRRDVESFAKTIGSEKTYIEAAKRYGLDHPTTYKNKAKLDASIKGFERDTGLKWPFK